MMTDGSVYLFLFSGLEGKTVQILIKGTIVNFLTIALDNIRIDATYSRNLAAESVTAPGK